LRSPLPPLRVCFVPLEREVSSTSRHVSFSCPFQTNYGPPDKRPLFPITRQLNEGSRRHVSLPAFSRPFFRFRLPPLSGLSDASHSPASKFFFCVSEIFPVPNCLPPAYCVMQSPSSSSKWAFSPPSSQSLSLGTPFPSTPALRSCVTPPFRYPLLLVLAFSRFGFPRS